VELYKRNGEHQKGGEGKKAEIKVGTITIRHMVISHR